mmetsp:Transcript_68868/g.119545  ORF Transcript_68868/g.119545 Transcript_68868/m.119545 type:complete len:249 (+) Transcript_68868:107-853(+)
MDSQVVSILLPLLACTVKLAAGSTAPASVEAPKFPGTVGERPEVLEETGEAECSRPPFCIKWWLADHTSWGALGSILLVIYAVGLALLVLLIVCVSLALLGRSCCSCCQGEDEDEAFADQQLAPHQRARLSNYPGYPRQYPPGYKPVEQRELEPDVEGYGTGKDGSQRNAAGTMGGMRIWCGALCIFCCGALLSGILVSSGAVLWWQASGSPPMAGFTGSNMTSDGHEGRVMEKSDKKARHAEKKAAE